jgi:hypothetical protein
MLEQLPDGERHKKAAAIDCRHRDTAEQRGRQTLHHEIAIFAEAFRRREADCGAVCERLARFCIVAHRDRLQRQSFNARDDASRDFKPDGAEPGDSNAKM